MHKLGLEFGSAAQLSKRPGSVWNCLWGHALKRSSGINRKSRVSYPVPGFLFSATWPSLPKKHYNGLNQTKPICVLLFQILFRYIRECYTQFLEGADTFEDLEAELARRLGSVTFSLEDRTYQASQQNLSEIQFNSNLEFSVCSFPL